MYTKAKQDQPAHDGHEGFRRHSRATPCPVCGGHAGLRKGDGVRCAGFNLDRVVYCTREEFAGTLPIEVTTSPPAYKHQLFGACGCGATHGWSAFDSGSRGSRRDTRGERPAPALDVSHEIYSATLDLLGLRNEALTDLTRRGLGRHAVLAAGYRSLPRRGTELRVFIAKLSDRFGEETLRGCPGFTDKNGRLTFWSAFRGRGGYIIPYRNEAGLITGLQAKILGGRYLTGRGTRLASVYHVSGPGGGGRDLWLTEGATKANVASQIADYWVFAVAGQSLAFEHVEAIRRMRPRRVIVALDQEDNINTKRAERRWLELLDEAGLLACRSVWEGEDVGGPKGLDDLCAVGRRARVRSVYFPPRGIGKRRTLNRTAEPGAVDPGASIADVRKTARQAIERFVAHAHQKAGRALLVRTPPASGKTRAVGEAIGKHRVQARILVGTNRLAREVAEGFGLGLIEGRNERNCERIDVVRALGTARA